MATRGFKPETTKKNEKFARKIRSQMIECEVSRQKMMKLADISSSTLSHRFYSEKASPEPDMMSVRELRVYCKVLKLSDEDILEFVREWEDGTGSFKDSIQR